MPGRLNGKVAVVTGGSRGIGRAICQAFAAEGAAVVVNFSSNADKAEELASGIRRGGGRAIALRADVASRGALEELMEATTNVLGPIDILVNNAGILRMGSTLTLDEAELDRMIDVNVKGIIYGVRAAAPRMIERRYGKIINLSSLAAFGTAIPDTTPYSITKAAIISLTKRLALELGGYNINVNAIAPGFIRTEMLQHYDDQPTLLEAVTKKSMLNRVGMPEDVARTAVFLATDESSFITAQVLTIDGGRMDCITHSG